MTDNEKPGLSEGLLNLTLALLSIVIGTLGIGLALKYKLELDGIIEFVK